MNFSVHDGNIHPVSFHKEKRNQRIISAFSRLNKFEPTYRKLLVFYFGSVIPQIPAVAVFLYVGRSVVSLYFNLSLKNGSYLKAYNRKTK
jgi:hypothetical protein